MTEKVAPNAAGARRVIDLDVPKPAVSPPADPPVGPTEADLAAATVIPGANPFVGLSPTQTLLAAGRWAGALGRHPIVLSGELLRWGAEEARVVAGVSKMEPDPKDKRFNDPAWRNPVWRRVVPVLPGDARQRAQLRGRGRSQSEER